MTGNRTHDDQPRDDVLKNGQWVDKRQTPGEMTLSAGPYAASTPSTIDAELAKLWDRQQRYLARVNADHTLASRLRAAAVLREASGAERSARDVARIAEAEARITAGQEGADAVQALIDPINDEFDARGGWTRFYVTTGGAPHVHRDMSCTSCYPTTQYGWLTDHSGMDEDEIVALAGDEACTYCYPSAPVADRGAPRQNRLETPNVRAARVKREAEAALRQEKLDRESITSPDGDPVYDERCRPFKSERAAELFAVAGLAETIRRDRDPDAEQSYAIAARVEDAIAVKRGIAVDELRAVWRKKLAAKLKRDGAPRQWERKGDHVFDGVDAHKAKVAGLERVRDRLAGASDRNAGGDADLAAVRTALDVAAGKLRSI